MGKGLIGEEGRETVVGMEDELIFLMFLFRKSLKSKM